MRSTFEVSDHGGPPFPEGDKRHYGYSRDKRSDCVQVVIALVGTPKGRLGRYEAQLLEQPWQTVRAGVQVKLLSEAGELYVLAESKDRVGKERSMRPRQLKGLVKRLKELAQMELTRDQLLLKLGAAKNQFPATWRLVTVRVPDKEVKIRPPNFTFALRRDKLRQLRRREGRYLLRSNLSAQAPEKLCSFTFN